MITPQTIQQITSRIDIIDVVGEFVKLKKRGTNYIGNCPFHNEKSPSFTVSPAKEIYKCFGCGKSGNTITFLMEHEKYSYVEALRWLAARYNIEIEETETSPAQKIAQQTADSLYAINHFAMDFFSKQYWDTEAGATIAQSYMQHRGFLRPIVEKFKIGYNPSERDSLAKALIQNQFNPELFARTGLVVERDGGWQDNYRDRIIFPIHNTTGKIIGFGARQIAKNDRSPKYINTPENEIYIKSRILYGSYFARTAIDKANECLLVEGYTDVVSLHQAGIENVVASGGTSLTIDQLRLVKKYTQNLTIIYDGDAAGVKAALRGLDMALEEGLNVQLVLIPDNEDPDSYVNKVGPDAFRAFVQSAKKDFILFQLEVQLKEVGNDLNKKNSLVNQMAETLSKINKAEDFTKLQEYVRKCANILRIDETGLTQLVNKFKRDKIVKDEKKMAYDEAAILMPSFQQETQDIDNIDLVLDKDLLHEKNLIRLLIEFGNENLADGKLVSNWIAEELEPFPLDNQEMIQLVKVFFEWQVAGKMPNHKTLQYHDDPQIQQMVMGLFEPEHELSLRWNEKLGIKKVVAESSFQHEIEVSLLYYKLRKIKKMIRQNQEDMEKVEGEEQIQLLHIHKHLKDAERELTKIIGTVIFK
ncbi:MAG: DNA primase [Chitinophagaceae bacterium]|jgi:DNA primase|nr:DNA primase [Chitinophagaceae bacterium]MCF8288958.1 DNA primase [Chitinophagaceae bacterium]MCF8421262.1 DNA primase [Chitinophagaceae bacterium]